ncbi:MAG: PadR family transcriptional regulator [Actinomycetota bacterium]|nr:PadR family transcriptional regulator [Actinomycetota bacterium]
MPIQHAVLALLADRPSHGYELKGSFEESVGPQWGELNIGHLYQVLDRLVRDGLVTKRTVSQSDRPDKTVYRLTPAGRAELDDWLATPFVRPGGYRDDFFLKLFAASRLGGEALAAVCRVQREAYLGELSTLGALRARHGDEPLVRLLIEAAVLHTEANLRIVELAESATDRIAGAAARRAPGDAGEPEAEQLAG